MRIISFSNEETNYQSPRFGILLAKGDRDTGFRLDCEKLFDSSARPSDPLAWFDMDGPWYQQSRDLFARMSNDVFLVAQGSLYPALVRMKRRGWLKTSWRNTENNRRARYYELTPAGRKQLDVHYSTWQRASAAIDGIMTARWAMGES